MSVGQTHPSGRLQRLLALLFAALTLASPAFAQEQRNSDHITPLGYCQLTGVSSATQVSTCTNGIPARTVWAIVCVETAAIRYRDDGTAPTTSVGMPVASGACFNYSGKFSALQVIAQTGAPVLDISFYSGAPKT